MAEMLQGIAATVSVLLSQKEGDVLEGEWRPSVAHCSPRIRTMIYSCILWSAPPG